MSITTETITSETGTTWTISCDARILTGTLTANITTSIKAERAGKLLVNGPVYQIESQIHPSIKPAILAAVRRLTMAAEGKTKESETARIASIEAVDRGYSQIIKAMEE